MASKAGDARTTFAGWNVVIGAGIGIAFGSVPLFASGFGLLSHAIAQQFNWNQNQVTTGASLFLLFQTIAYPLCGWPLDRWGSRRFAMASILLFAGALLVLSRIEASLTQYYLAFSLIGLVSAGTNVVSYARAITLWFNRRRGLALGLAASAQALGSFLIPLLARGGIPRYGWPVALALVAVFELLVCMPLVGWLIKDSPSAWGHWPDGDPAPLTDATLPPEPFMDVGQIMRTATFWKLAICFFVMGLTFYAVATNIAYILTQTCGLPLDDVAPIQAASALAVLFGRIGFGRLLDRLHAPWVAVLTLACSAVSAAAYASLSSFPVLLCAAMIGGLAIGGESDLMPYLASRFFGTRSISKIFGWFLFAFFVGATIGPSAFSQISTAFHGAALPLWILVAAQLIPAGLFLSLGRAPHQAGHPTDPALAVAEPLQER